MTVSGKEIQKARLAPSGFSLGLAWPVHPAEVGTLRPCGMYLVGLPSPDRSGHTARRLLKSRGPAHSRRSGGGRDHDRFRARQIEAGFGQDHAFARD